MVENVIEIKSGIIINVNASAKNIIYVKKNYIWNPATCSCKNGKYLASITDNSMITCDEVMDAEETKTIPENIICKTKRFYILLALYFTCLYFTFLYILYFT